MAEIERERVRVAIVGCGFAGITAAKRLKDEGIEDFVILERGDDVGGVWHFNTYPGCRCDVPSHLYSLSFAPNPEWSHTYSPQPEILEYLGSCADRFGIRPHLRTNTSVEAASWNEGEQLWEIETDNGSFAATILISGMGPLTEPHWPEIPGLSSFEGELMHSARWDHEYELEGKRVASIGTGASAIQYVPEIRKRVDHLTVFQRTPPWIMPHNDRPISDRERSLFRRLPIVQRAMRAGIYWGRELLVFGFARRPKLMDQLEKIARSHIERQVPDPGLRAKVTPDYAVGCKRLLPSNRWYPALGEDNVELVTSGIEEVRPRSIVDRQGVEHEVDAIILGTGFHVTDAPFADQIRGRDGETLGETWQGSPRAYLGTSVPGFPNLFLLLGANTGLGHGSMVFMIEAQVEHAIAAIAAMDRQHAATVEVRQPAFEAYNRNIDKRMASTVWSTGGCSSWYTDETGRNASQYPDFTWRFRRKAVDFDQAAYEIRTPMPQRVAA